MCQRDYETYVELFQNQSNFMRHPTLLVHLDVDLEQSLASIRANSKSSENVVDIEYLKELNEEYNRFLNDISTKIPVIRVKMEQNRSVDEVAAHVLSEFSKIKRIVQVNFENVVQDLNDKDQNWFF